MYGALTRPGYLTPVEQRTEDEEDRLLCPEPQLQGMRDAGLDVGREEMESSFSFAKRGCYQTLVWWPSTSLIWFPGGRPTPGRGWEASKGWHDLRWVRRPLEGLQTYTRVAVPMGTCLVNKITFTLAFRFRLAGGEAEGGRRRWRRRAEVVGVRHASWWPLYNTRTCAWCQRATHLALLLSFSPAIYDLCLDAQALSLALLRLARLARACDHPLARRVCASLTSAADDSTTPTHSFSTVYPFSVRLCSLVAVHIAMLRWTRAASTMILAAPLALVLAATTASGVLAGTPDHPISLPGPSLSVISSSEMAGTPTRSISAHAAPTAPIAATPTPPVGMRRMYDYADYTSSLASSTSSSVPPSVTLPPLTNSERLARGLPIRAPRLRRALPGSHRKSLTVLFRELESTLIYFSFRVPTAVGKRAPLRGSLTRRAGPSNVPRKRQGPSMLPRAAMPTGMPRRLAPRSNGRGAPTMESMDGFLRYCAVSGACQSPKAKTESDERDW
jgi:hypothetical protein